MRGRPLEGFDPLLPQGIQGVSGISQAYYAQGTVNIADSKTMVLPPGNYIISATGLLNLNPSTFAGPPQPVLVSCTLGWPIGPTHDFTDTTGLAHINYDVAINWYFNATSPTNINLRCFHNGNGTANWQLIKAEITAIAVNNLTVTP